MRGFVDACTEAGCAVTGGQTIQNPWPIIGGVASATCSEAELVRPEGAQPGDALVLTKPLGTQVAANLWQWRGGAREASRARFDKIAHLLVGSGDAADAAVAAAGGLVDPAAVYDQACAQMGRLNRAGAAAMHAHGAHAATDVTGFGLLGHADNLALHSTARVRFDISLLPVIRGTARVDDALGGNFRLRLGLSAETSGGLLVALPPERAEAFIAALAPHPAWVVGTVRAAAPGEANGAAVAADARVLEV